MKAFMAATVKFGLAIGLLLASSPAFGQQIPLSKYGPDAVRLYAAREHVQQQPAPDFWATIPYYVGQPDERSCSLAAVTTMLNALKAGSSLNADEPLVTCDKLLEEVNLPQWNAALGPQGQGVSLDELGQIIRACAKVKQLGIKVEVVHVRDASETARRALHTMLVENERSASDLVVVNFLQSAFTGDPEGNVGHFAVVAAYDGRNRRVLILDPDRRWYEPYWVSEDAFLAGLASRDSVAGDARGYIRVQTIAGVRSERRPDDSRK